jgi:ribose-phosphate pyrophosphokinase
MTVIGEVKDKNVILVDDIVDTAGTITKAADLLLQHGASSVRALCSHPVMSDPATERVLNSGLTEIIFTNSIPYTKDKTKATVLPVAKLFADTIRRIHNNQSISSQYLFK